MTAPLHDAIQAPPARPRPRLHFTADDGWINDPYGIVWSGDRYQLFYQAAPGRVTWSPRCRWGRAESPDLVHWRAQSPALLPQPSELGCWSGTAVPDQAGLRLIYSRVTEPDWSKAAIAAALPVDDGWVSDPDDALMPGPPDDLDVHTFRDPFVFARGTEWVMVVGAGLSNGAGAVIQYRSPDLERWTCDGVLASRVSTPADDVWTGAVWECPQFFPLGDSWVLLVSVWHDDVLHHVAAAIGDYEGREFVARRWQQLTYGNCAYAMTSFVDRSGRRCVMSWLREEPQNDPTLNGWAGAHSVAAVLTLDDDGHLALEPHPDLATLPSAAVKPASAGTDRVSLGSGPAELVLPAAPGTRMTIIEGQRTLVALEVDATGAMLHAHRPGRPDGSIPVHLGEPLRLLVDADLLEVFGPGGYGAFRIAVALDPEATELVITPATEFALHLF